MILRIDHVALAVRDYEKACKFFTQILGAIPGANAPDESLKFLWQNLSLGDLSRLELITPTAEDSFLKNFLKNKQGGVHHITLQTSDITLAKKTLEHSGIPYFGYSEQMPVWKELFIHPDDAFGVLIQIAEFNPEDWIAPSEAFDRQRKYSVKKINDGCSVIIPHPGGGKVALELSRTETMSLIEELNNCLHKSF